MIWLIIILINIERQMVIDVRVSHACILTSPIFGWVFPK